MGKVLTGVVAVIAAAALTLGAMVTLVHGTIFIVSIARWPLRILAVAADMLVGSILLLGCLYLATHLAVRLLGVGDSEFPPLPETTPPTEPPKN